MVRTWRRDLPLPTLRSSALRVCSNLLSLTNPHAKYWRARAAAGQLATPLTNDPQLVITQLQLAAAGHRDLAGDSRVEIRVQGSDPAGCQ